MPNTLVNGAIPGFYTPTQLLDLIGSTRGSLLYRGASQWSALTPGTAGFFLQSQGAGADPIWAAASGAGLGDFSGPAVSVDTGVVIFDGISGKNGKACAVTISVAGAVAGVTTINTSGNATFGAGTSVIETKIHGVKTVTDGEFARLTFANTLDIAGGYETAAIWAERSIDDNSAALIFGTANTASSPTERFRITKTGNVLFGTTTDSSNGRIQLVADTSAGGGIGFGTDLAVYRVGAKTLAIQGTGADGTLYVKRTSDDSLFYMSITNGGAILSASYSTTGSYKDVIIRTSDLNSFTIDTSGNCTARGSLTTAAPTVGAAAAWKLGAYTAGAAAQAGKLRVNVGGVDYDILTA